VNPPGVEIEAVTGAAIADHLDALAALRIAVFRDYPYLYVGSLAHEQRYLASYARSPDHLIVLARDAGRVVGAATAMPVAQHTEEIAPVLARAGTPAEAVCYFGESVLEPAYRGRGIGRAFFDHRERHARDRGFTVAAFCAVVRPPDHPRRPPGYVPHDAFWTRRGFRERPELTMELRWRDLDDADETAKPMVFWIKERL
jgi:GNAT superfamily N-acetyltransferase